jgi:hypothetical protein
MKIQFLAIALVLFGLFSCKKSDNNDLPSCVEDFKSDSQAAEIWRIRRDDIGETIYLLKLVPEAYPERTNEFIDENCEQKCNFSDVLFHACLFNEDPRWEVIWEK